MDVKTSNGVDAASVLMDMLECPGGGRAVNGSDVCGDYESLADAVHFFAYSLTAAGITAGARVGILVGDGQDLVVALCAVGTLGATAAVLDSRDLPCMIASKIDAAGLDFLLGHHTADHLLDELTCVRAVPTIVADDFTLAEVDGVRPRRTRGIVFFDTGSALSTLGWGEMFDAAHRLADDIGLDRHSSVSVAGLPSTPWSLTTLFAAFTAGAAVSLGDVTVDETRRHPSDDVSWNVDAPVFDEVPAGWQTSGVR